MLVYKPATGRQLGQSLNNKTQEDDEAIRLAKLTRELQDVIRAAAYSLTVLVVRQACRWV